MAEATAVIGSTEISGSEFGHSIVVPTNAKSKLMYYLSCINTLMKKKGERTEPAMRKLCDYGKHHLLTEEETDKLVLICFMLSPDVLLNKCVFIDNELCKDYDNNFFELSAVRNRFVVTRNLMIGGEQKTVHRIMACRYVSVNTWIIPICLLVLLNDPVLSKVGVDREFGRMQYQ